MNDRMRVEAAIVPAMIFRTMAEVVLETDKETQQDREFFEKVMQGALEASYEPFADMLPKDRAKLVRRVDRVAISVCSMLYEQTVAKILMSIYYLLEGLLQDGRLVLYDGSSFAEAMQVILDPLQERFQKEKLDKSAQRKAQKLREHLVADGYFR